MCRHAGLITLSLLALALVAAPAARADIVDWANGDASFTYSGVQSFFDASANPIDPDTYFNRVISSLSPNILPEGTTVYDASENALFTVIFWASTVWDPQAFYHIDVLNSGGGDLTWTVDLGVDPLPFGNYVLGDGVLTATTSGGDISNLTYAIDFVNSPTLSVSLSAPCPATSGSCSDSNFWILPAGDYTALRTRLDLTVASGALASVEATADVFATPEPGAVSLFGLGLGALALGRALRRRMARA